MPDAGEQLHHEQVEDLPLQALAVAAQRDIDILAEPAGKGHVPAPPELSDGAGDIGEVEVLGEIEAQHLAHTDGHHGVTGKIKVELERIGDDTQPDQRRGRIGKAHKGVEGLSAMPMMSVQSAPTASASRTFFARPKVNRVMPSSICCKL